MLKKAKDSGWNVLIFTSSQTAEPLFNESVIHQWSKEYFSEGFNYLHQSIETRYGPYFGLSPNETNQLIAYMRIWEDLRRCCGFQMSKGWSNILQDRSKGPHFCQGKNITMLESDLLNDDLSLKHPILRQESLFPPGHRLNGSWCDFARTQIENGAGFNAAGAMQKQILEISKTFKWIRIIQSS